MPARAPGDHTGLVAPELAPAPGAPGSRASQPAHFCLPPAQCARDVVRLLLSHRADTSLLWSGHSPLSLSIVSGNDLVSECGAP